VVPFPFRSPQAHGPVQHASEIKVKVPTLTAKSAVRMGHPAGARESVEFRAQHVNLSG